jgi:Zn finger protein HypA/HybF involved in hydrogenase expression
MSVAIVISFIGLLITVITILVKFVVDNAKKNHEHDIYIKNNKKQIEDLKLQIGSLIGVNEKYLEKFYKMESEIRSLNDKQRKGDNND